jgi:transposase
MKQRDKENLRDLVGSYEDAASAFRRLRENQPRASHLHRKERGSMKQFIGCDVHKRYSVFVSMDETGKASRAVRVAHGNGELDAYLSGLPAGTPVAVEATGHWYWLLDAIEKAGLEAHLAHALAAKRMMVSPNKTDKLDAKGLATLLLNGSLPEVWVPNGKVRDLRGLLRSRLALRRMGTALKNRISSALARYGLPGTSAATCLAAGR